MLIYYESGKITIWRIEHNGKMQGQWQGQKQGHVQEHVGWTTNYFCNRESRNSIYKIIKSVNVRDDIIIYNQFEEVINLHLI